MLGAVADGMAACIQPWSAVARSREGLSISQITDLDLIRPNLLCSVPSELLSPVVSMARELVREEVGHLVKRDGWRSVKGK